LLVTYTTVTGLIRFIKNLATRLSKTNITRFRVSTNLKIMEDPENFFFTNLLTSRPRLMSNHGSLHRFIGQILYSMPHQEVGTLSELSHFISCLLLCLLLSFLLNIHTCIFSYELIFEREIISEHCQKRKTGRCHSCYKPVPTRTSV
jgi:hypothetical protein